jgi:hypothetical protein
MKVARFGAGLIAANGALYAVGGNGAADDVEVSKVAPDGGLGPWATTTRLPMGLDMFGLAAAGGYLYVAGGRASSLPEVASVFSAPVQPDAGLGSWSALTPLPSPRSFAQAFALDGHLVVIGGDVGANTSVVHAPLLDAGLIGAWTAMPDLAGGSRWGEAAAEENGAIVIAGGSVDGTITNRVWSSSLLEAPNGRAAHVVKLAANGGRIEGLLITGTASASASLRASLRVAGSDGVFGAPVDLGPVTLGTELTVSPLPGQAAEVTLTLSGDAAVEKIDVLGTPAPAPAFTVGCGCGNVEAPSATLLALGLLLLRRRALRGPTSVPALRA